RGLDDRSVFQRFVEPDRIGGIGREVDTRPVRRGVRKVRCKGAEGRRRRLQFLAGNLHRLEACKAVRDRAGNAVLVIVAHELEAGGIDEATFTVRYERAGARQEWLAVAVLDDEKAVSVHSEVGTGGGVLDRAGLRDR